MLSVTNEPFMLKAECRYAVSRYAEYHGALSGALMAPHSG